MLRQNPSENPSVKSLVGLRFHTALLLALASSTGCTRTEDTSSFPIEAITICQDHRKGTNEERIYQNFSGPLGVTNKDKFYTLLEEIEIHDPDLYAKLTKFINDQEKQALLSQLGMPSEQDNSMETLSDPLREWLSKMEMEHLQMKILEIDEKNILQARVISFTETTVSSHNLTLRSQKDGTWIINDKLKYDRFESAIEDMITIESTIEAASRGELGNPANQDEPFKNDQAKGIYFDSELKLTNFTNTFIQTNTKERDKAITLLNDLYRSQTVN